MAEEQTDTSSSSNNWIFWLIGLMTITAIVLYLSSIIFLLSRTPAEGSSGGIGIEKVIPPYGFEEPYRMD